MKKFQERKIKKLREEYIKTEKLLDWCYLNPDTLTQLDTETDLYVPMNVKLVLDKRRAIRNKIKSIILNNSKIKFFNLSTNEKKIKMEQLGKEFDILF